MIPHAASALRMLAQRIMMSVLPEVKSAYVAADGAMVSMLLTALSSELESGVANRVSDIEEMKAILARYSDRVENPEELLSLTPASFRLTEVNRVHDLLTRALILLHETVEVENVSEAQANINREIFVYLHDHAERHKLSI
ncbi:MAG: hypothetical protein WD002_08680 [Pseudomonadales bacterium]